MLVASLVLTSVATLSPFATGTVPAGSAALQQSESEVSRAVNDACRWLVAHQDEDGRWDSDGFMKHDGAGAGRGAEESDDAFWERVLGEEPGTVADSFAEPTGARPGAGGSEYDVGVTGLALLALVADGHTPNSGAHAHAVARGVDWLVRQQDPESGRLGLTEHLTVHYDHAIGTLALATALGASAGESRPAAHGVALQRAVDYIHRARNPYGAWRYAMPPNGENDSSITAWMVLALHAAENAGAAIDRAAYEGALAWFDEVSDPETGRVGYSERGSRSSRVPSVNVSFAVDRTETLTAGALLCRLRMGADPRREPGVVEQVKLVLDRSRHMPEDSLHDAIWLYWGTAAMAELGSRPWREWSDRAAGVLVGTQATEEGVAGSWEPNTAWGYATGRVGTTALIATALASFERSPAEPEPEPAVAADPASSIQSGLEWLANHQDENGRWDCDGFFEHDPANERTDGAGEPIHDIGCTGLALLAFLGDGNTLTRGPYKDTVKRGVRWLLDQQDLETGLIGDEVGHAFLYDHAIATLAICETSVMQPTAVIGARAQRAVNYIVRARNPYGVWRYEVPPNGDNDTSVTAWMILALKSAEDAGLEIDREAYPAAIGWFDEMTDPRTGRVGYSTTGSSSSRVPGMNIQYPVESGEAMTAAALLCRFFLGQDPDENGNSMTQHADLLLGTPPEWSPERFGCDMYYWYFGTYAMYQMGGEYWKKWNEAMKRVALESQRADGAFEGSWDPVGPWGYAGGRVYSTAVMVLTLEASFRYSKVIGTR